MALMVLDQLSLAFGDQVLLNNIQYSIEPGQRIALVGRNGAGKSSLLKILDGRLTPDGGHIRQDKDLTVRTLEQELPEAVDMTLFEVVAEGLGDLGHDLKRYHELLHHAESEAALKELEHLQESIERQDGWRFDQKVQKTLEQLQLDPEATLSSLSGGWRRRVMLGQALVAEPDILLLDEPTNHLDIPAIQWLEDQLLDFNGTLIFISHDRQFLDRIATHILELDRGELYHHPGEYAQFLDRRTKRLEDEDRANSLQDQKLAEEETWIRQGIKARRTRNEGRVRALKALRQTRSQRVNLQGKANMAVEVDNLSGKKVLEAQHLSFQHAGAENPIIQNFDALVIRGDRIGLLGANGCGKSTLIKLLLDELTPSSGKVKQGSQLTIGYFDQLRAAVDPEKNIIENVSQGREFITINNKNRHIYSYLSDFLFTPERARTPVKALSGGEHNRVMLAKLFSKPCNMMILDEPTNDLDVDTLELLEELLADFPGTLIIASHDRAFLDAVVSELWVFEGEGNITQHVGGYSDWYARGNRLNDPSATNHTSTEKDITKVKIASAEADSNQVKTKRANTKLSYKLQRELDALPAEIEQQEAKVNALKTASESPDFYNKPNQEVLELLAELQQAQSELEILENRWLELEAMQEELSK